LSLANNSFPSCRNSAQRAVSLKRESVFTRLREDGLYNCTRAEAEMARV
jgi:hypothetical protein